MCISLFYVVYLCITKFFAENIKLTYYGRVTQICVFTSQLCKTDDANLRF